MMFPAAANTRSVSSGSAGKQSHGSGRRRRMHYRGAAPATVGVPRHSVTPKSVGRRRYFVTHVRRTHQWLVPSCTNLQRFGRRFDAKWAPMLMFTNVLPCRWTPFQGFRFIYNIADDFRPRIRKNTGLGDVNFYSERIAECDALLLWRTVVPLCNVDTFRSQGQEVCTATAFECPSRD